MRTTPVNRRGKLHAEALGHRPGHEYNLRHLRKGKRKYIERMKRLARLNYTTIEYARTGKKRGEQKPKEKK